MEPILLRRTIEFADTDLSGLVHFSRFFVFMETAEHEAREALGFPVHMQHEGREIGWPRVAAHCDYRSPVRFGDELEIQVRVERRGQTSLTFRFEMHCAERRVAEGYLTSVCCALGGDRLELVPIPDGLVGRLSEGE